MNSETLVLASDNSGGIGLKDMDMVKTPYDVVAYYGFRVAVMEWIALGEHLFLWFCTIFVGMNHGRIWYVE